MKSTIVISEASRLKAQEVKRYITKKYNLNTVKEEQKRMHWQMFQQKVRELNLSIQETQQAKRNILHQQCQDMRRKREKVSKRSFQAIGVIGRGAFGEVRLCRERKTGRVVAIKCLKKKEMIQKKQETHLKAERNMLAGGGDWIVSLLYSFQDQTYLYLVMQYLPGGDLMNLLIIRNILEEHEVKFYAAQIILAIESMHSRGYIHRDIKPDNVLIDERGHIKLSDFGLCKETETADDPLTNEAIHSYVPGEITNSSMSNFKKYLSKQRSARDRKLAFSAVGTPDYIAPEMLKRVGYGELVDWWALGVIIYEMLIGYAPFSADSNDQIYYKIQHYQEYLYFPPQIKISFEVIDLISRLLTDPEYRLGRNGVDEIKNHSWFKDINWSQIRNIKPPFVPQLESAIDSKYFDKYDQVDPWLYEGEDSYKKDFNFIGYTYKLESEPNKNIVKDEMERVQKLKEKEKQLEKVSMKKKNKIMIVGHGHEQSKNIFHRLQIQENWNQKQEVQTQRGKPRKSKSPLNMRDTNRLKTKQSTSKSPLKLDYKAQRPTCLTRKVAPLNLQGLSISALGHGGGELTRTLTSRRSVKKNR